MADSRIITKELLGLEDILTGVGAVNQTRGGVSLPITKINASNLSYDAAQTIKAAIDGKASNLLNIAALKAYVTILGQTEYKYLQGYAVSGDSGGGLFWLDTSDTSSAEDLISIFNPDDVANGRWKRIELGDSMSADNGDADLTLVVGDEVIQRFSTALTVSRAITLPIANLFKGLRYRVVYDTSNTGAFTLAVGALYTFGIGETGEVEVMYDGTAWVLIHVRTSKPVQYAGDAGGTVDAITAAVGIKSYADGDIVFLRSLGDNTVVTPSVNFDALGAKTVVKNGDAELAVNDMGPAGRELILKRNEANDNFELINPAPFTGGVVTKAWGILTVNTAIDLALADLHIIEAGASITLTFSSTRTSDRATVAIQNGGGWTITPAGIDNNSPTLTVGTNVQDIIGLMKTHGKISLVGFVDNVSAV